MRKHFYRKSTGDLVFYDTLETLQLNHSAQLIYEGVAKSLRPELIAHELANQYAISFAEAFEDTLLAIQNLKSLGIESSPSLQFTPHTVILHIIKNCNSPCQLCDCWQTKSKTLHTLEKIKPLLSWLAKKGNKNIMVSGGEPLLHPEVESICKEIRYLEMQVLLNTNGLLLHKAAWIKTDLVSEVVISMDGFDASSYKAIRGIDAYERVWNNIQILKNQDPDLPLSLRIILNKMNLFQLPQIFEKARRFGISRVGLSPLDVTSTSFARHNMNIERENNLKSQFLPDSQDILRFREFLDAGFAQTLGQYYNDGLSDWSVDDYLRCLEYYAGEPEQKSSLTADPCLFPINSMVIDYDGSLKTCFYSKAVTTLETPEQYDHVYSAELDRMKATDQCKNCRGKVFCDVRIS